MSAEPRSDGEPLIDTANFAARDRSLRALARSLVGDGATADDLVQDTWSAALRTGVRPRSAIAWLRGALCRLAMRSARTAARRRRRELEVGREEAVPAVVDALAREAERRHVVDALTALPEPYRTSLVLRFLEDLPPAEIAQRLGEPVETVRTRIKRGVEMLRRRLSGRVAGLLFIPLDRVLVGLSGLSFLLMAAKTKLIGAAALALLCAGGIWWLNSESPRPSSPRPGDREPEPLARIATAPVEEARVDAPKDANRRVVEAPDEARRADGARVVLEVRWADGAAVQDMEIDLEPRIEDGEEREDEVRRARTDAEGLVVFESVESGGFLAVSDGRSRSFMPIDVGAPGSETRVHWVLVEGATVRGRVVDRAGQPVATAEIVVQTWAGNGRSWGVARSDVDGRFAVRDVTEAIWFGARHPRFAPSPMQVSFAKAGGELQIELQLGDGPATLTGTVRGPDGAVIVGARVYGSSHENSPVVKLPDGSRGMAPAQVRTRTDERGRFEMTGLAPGPRVVSVRAPELALWSQSIEIEPGGARDLEVLLARGGTLVGRLRDADQNAIRKLSIDVTMGNLELGSGTTDAKGEFTIPNLPIGTVRVRAFRSGRIVEHRQVEIVADAMVRFDFDFPPTRRLRGRVLDRSGEGLPDCHIDAFGRTWSGDARTDADGRFVFESVSADSLRIIVERWGFPIAELRIDLGRAAPVDADTEHEIRLDIDGSKPAVISGRVVDSEGRAVAGATVSPLREGPVTSTGIHPIDRESGAFRFEHCPPGNYRLRFEAPGFGSRSLVHEIEAGIDWELGDVVLGPPGYIALRLFDGERLHESAGSRVAVYTIEGASTDSIEVKNGIGSSAPLGSGRYRLVVRENDRALTAAEVEVESGATTRIDVPLEPGVTVRLRLPVATTGEVKLVTLTGAPMRSLFRSEGAADDIVVMLRPGGYRLVPQRGTAFEFTVAPTPGEMTVDVPRW